MTTVETNSGAQLCQSVKVQGLTANGSDVELEHCTSLKNAWPIPNALVETVTPYVHSDASMPILHLTVGAKLGDGSISEVHNVNQRQWLSSAVWESEGIRPSVPLPPLVIKIAIDAHSSKAIEREAWVYEQMKDLQGVCVPRYYGCYRGQITQRLTLSGWEHEKLQVDGPYMSIILLEKLGAKLPLNTPVLPADRDELMNIMKELQRLRIYHNDIKHGNILRAAEEQEFPPLVSPFSNRVYPNWRLIDFNIAIQSRAKEPGDSDSFYDVGTKYMKNVLDDIEQGDTDVATPNPVPEYE